MIADIGQHHIEQRKFRFGGRNGKTRVGHQRQQPGGLERYGLAACIRPADQQRAVPLIERQGYRNHRLILRAQDVFEQRMARLHLTPAFARPAGLRRGTAHAKAIANSAFAKSNSIRPKASAVRAISAADWRNRASELAQNAVNFAQLLFAHAHQLIVEIDCFERLDEQRVAASAGAVDHSFHATFAARDHGNHESIVADGHKVFLKSSVLLVRAQKTLERFLDQMALLLGVATQPRQSDAGMIGHCAVGENLSTQLRDQFAQIGNRGGMSAQAGKPLSRGQ